jgi:hypothetical protein
MSPPRESCDVRHDYALLSDFVTGGWRVDCSCGWEGPDRKTVAEAARDADSHREEVQR